MADKRDYKLCFSGTATSNPIQDLEKEGESLEMQNTVEIDGMMGDIIRSIIAGMQENDTVAKILEVAVDCYRFEKHGFPVGESAPGVTHD